MRRSSMAHQPDLVGTIFFGLCAVALLCLTLWPRLWIALSVNRRWARKAFGRTQRLLSVVSGIGTALGVYASLGCYFWF